MASPRPAAVDTARRQAFMDKMVGDMSAAMSGALVLIGDKLGLYRSLAADGPATSAELAERTETAERANGSPPRPPPDTSRTTSTAGGSR
jgi:hypothetical protein